MPAAANYILFADKAFELTASNNIVKWDFHSNVAPWNKQALSSDGILTFMLHIKDGDDLKFMIEAGSQKVASFTLSDDHYTTVQEIIGANQIAAGNFFFTRTGGTGTLKISDVVLWFQVNA